MIMKKTILLLAVFSAISLKVAAFFGEQIALPYTECNPSYDGFTSVLLKPIEVKNDSVKAKKFTYAEAVYQNNTIAEKMWVSGSAVPQAVRNSVAAAKYTVSMLDIMGNNGWELISSTARNFDGGFEIFYYFKKEISQK